MGEGEKKHNMTALGSAISYLIINSHLIQIVRTDNNKHNLILPPIEIFQNLLTEINLTIIFTSLSLLLFAQYCQENAGWNNWRSAMTSKVLNCLQQSLPDDEKTGLILSQFL